VKTGFDESSRNENAEPANAYEGEAERSNREQRGNFIDPEGHESPSRKNESPTKLNLERRSSKSRTLGRGQGGVKRVREVLALRIGQEGRKDEAPAVARDG